MSFEAHIPEHIKELEAKGKQLYWERAKLAHSCDCEYCEYDEVPEENQDDWDKLTAKMKDCEEMIDRIKAHAKLHGVSDLVATDKEPK